MGVVGAPFDGLMRASIEWAMAITRDDVVAMVVSRSDAIALDDAERHRLAHEGRARRVAGTQLDGRHLGTRRTAGCWGGRGGVEPVR
jgi:hypothetical protein